MNAKTTKLIRLKEAPMRDDKVLSSPQQRRFAELLVRGEMSVVDCYIDAYAQTPEQCEDRQKLSSRAYMASKTKGVLAAIKSFQEAQAVEEARILVWDKRKAAQFLLKMCREIEVNIDITRKLRDQMVQMDISAPQKLSQMLKVAQVCNETSMTIKECIKEMNNMYGLSKPETSLVAAVQVIIGNEEELPDDTVDEAL